MRWIFGNGRLNLGSISLSSTMSSPSLTWGLIQSLNGFGNVLVHSRSKFFGWLLLMDRLNTRDMMQRRHWNIQDDTCVLCQSSLHEDRVHLFFSCNFSQRVWNYLVISWQALPNQSTFMMASASRKDFYKPFFSEVVFTAAWNIWTQRNGKIFRNEDPSFRSWRRSVVHDLSLLAHRIKCKYRDSLLAWIASFP